MPKTVVVEGKTHNFPDDFTEDEIAAVLGGAGQVPSQQPALAPSVAFPAEVRQIDNAILERAKYAKMLKDRKLNTRDQNLFLSFFRPAHEVLAEERADLTESNWLELNKELKRTKHPRLRKVLEAERKRMKQGFANILGVEK